MRGTPLSAEEVEVRRQRARRRMPPIEGLPVERPVCVWCQKKLRPVSNGVYESGKLSGALLRRTFVRWDAYRDVFCTLQCALNFADASYRGGYRRAR
jgi:hypothetical protein